MTPLPHAQEDMASLLSLRPLNCLAFYNPKTPLNRSPPIKSPPPPPVYTSSVETRRAPSRHFRDARVYGHTTKAMHDNEYSVKKEERGIPVAGRRKK